MKSPLVILFFSFFCLQTIHVYALFDNYTVIIRNDVSPQKGNLSAYFLSRSGERNLGDHPINHGQELILKFTLNFFNTTNYACHFQCEGQRKAVTLFDTEVADKFCRNKICFLYVDQRDFYWGTDYPNADLSQHNLIWYDKWSYDAPAPPGGHPT